MADPFSVFLLYDSLAPADETKLLLLCAARGAQCEKNPLSFNSEHPSHRNSRMLHYLIQTVCFGPTKPHSHCLVMDADIFLISPFSVVRFLNGAGVGIVKQRRGFLRYGSSHLIALDVGKVRDKEEFNFLIFSNSDTGGRLHVYFRRHRDDDVRNFRHTSHISRGRGNIEALPQALWDDYDDAFSLEIFEKAFLHYGSASNWKEGVYRFGGDPFPEKSSFVQRLVRGCMNGTLVPSMLEYAYAYDIWAM